MKILLVEEDQLLRAVLTRVLIENRYAVDQAWDGQIALELATNVEYDLILLSAGISKLDSFSFCRQLRSRRYQKPILLLTTNDSDAIAVAGFEAGADDCISKSCAPEVLLARMRTWLRRSRALGQGQETTFIWDQLSFDWDAGRVTWAGQVIPLTATEYHLLELFLRNPDRIFSRSVILDRLWGLGDAPTDRAINTYIKDLRKKLKAAGLTEEMIETIYGMGYRLKPAPKRPDTETHSTAPLQREKNPSSAITTLLKRFQGVFEERLVILEQAQNQLWAGSLGIELQQSARQEAHKLAGALGSFGYPEGSKLARSLEYLLMQESFTSEDISHFSEFVVSLRQTLSQPPVNSLTPAALSVQNYRLLVIDDDEALTEQLKVEADSWGFRLKIAANLAEARSRLNLTLPDVVLLDLSFSETEEDDLIFLQELTTRARSVPLASPKLPIIVFTGRDSLTDRLQASRLGARQFLHKPATTQQIFQAIARVLAPSPSSEAKVLIVDDDPSSLDFLSAMLTPWGVEVITLSEPERFWKVLTASLPDLILLDLEMPAISGLELCQVVRQDSEWGDLPILVVTARTDTESLQKAFEVGADDFINKPVLGPELVTRVLSRIERYRLHQKLGKIGNS
ncbi:MAG: response regulator [Snowella sp.]|nr:response regulator [Snowella sp.]